MGDEQRPPEESQQRFERQKVLADLGIMALEGGSLDELMDELVLRVAEGLSVEFCKILEFVADDDVLLLRSGVGWDEELVGQAVVETGLDSQAGYTLISDKPVVVENLRAEERFKGPPLLLEHGVTSGASVAVRVRGRIFGILGVHTGDRRTFTEEEIEFLQEVANVLGVAIEHRLEEEDTRLALAEKTEQAEAAERRYRFLSEANEVISTAPDYAEVLHSTARLMVPALADWCFLDVVDGSTVHRLVVVHSDPDKEDHARELQYDYPLSSGALHGTPKVMRAGCPEVFSRVDDGLLRGIALNAKHLEILRNIEPVSYMCVPLQVRWRSVGTIGLMSAESGRRFEQEDITLAEGVARCAALAIENALHHLPEVEVIQELVRLAGEGRKVVSSPKREIPPLTPRQFEVLRMLAAGKSVKEIRTEMHLSEATVRNHIRSVLQALDAHSQLEALARARDLGLLPR